IDTHCHLDIDSFAHCHLDLLKRARSIGVVNMILPGVVQSGWNRLLKICSETEGLYAAPGLHPMYLSHHTLQHLDELRQLVRSSPVVALGEIGLDYYDKSFDREAQQRLFEEQLDIAKKAHLPILLHVRKAHDQVLATLRRKHFVHGGIVHAFNGSFQQAQRYISFGFGLGIGGTITYARARRIRQVASELPSNSLVLESDAPDIPPANHRGETNLPEYLIEVVEGLAEVRRKSCDCLAACTTANARRLLGLPA
ncbi:MAG: TatD family hydrolase, partial [Desulforhopalus sp.]